MSGSLSKTLSTAITSSISITSKPVALHEPELTGNERKYVDDCIKSGWVSTSGKYLERFEKEIGNYTGIRNVIATMNGTAALHLALKVLGIQENDEIIVSTLGFIATANAVTYCNAIPHFVDIEKNTLGIDPEKLENYLENHTDSTAAGLVNKNTGRVIRAIICMHAFGHPVDLDRLCAVAKRFELSLVEDGAESLGSTYKNNHCGNYGKISILSFNGNKIITTGGGGALLTNDDSLADRARHIGTTAKLKHPWLYNHDEAGFNFRMPNINAAMGCAQIERISEFVSKKRKLAGRYMENFSEIEEASIFCEPQFSKSNYWLNVMLLDKSVMSQRDQVLSDLNNDKILVRPAWTLLHKQKPYLDCPKMESLEVSDEIESSLINLPSSPCLVEDAA